MRRLGTFLRAIADAVDPPDEQHSNVPSESGDLCMPPAVHDSVTWVTPSAESVWSQERGDINGETPAFIRSGVGLYL